MTVSPGDAGSRHLHQVSDVTSYQLTRCLSHLRPLPEDCENPEETEQSSAGGEGQRPGEVKGFVVLDENSPSIGMQPYSLCHSSHL